MIITILNGLFEKFLYSIYPKFFKDFNNFKSFQIIKKGETYPFKTIYKDVKEQTIIKSVSTRYKNIYTDQLNNEIAFLKFLERTGGDIKTSKHIALVKSKNNFSVKQSLLPGTQLSTFDSNYILNSFDIALNYLGEKSKNLDSQLPIRKSTEITRSFPFYFLTALSKEPKMAISLILLADKFYKNSKDVPNDYVISHRDLTPENIIVDKKGKIKIIDFEVAKVAEKFTDLALFPRFYIDYLTSDQIIKYLKSKLVKKKDISQFIRLTIFYTFQFLFIEDKNSRYYKEAIRYISLLTKKILPTIQINKKTLGEKTYFKVLDMIKNNKPPKNKNVILCYHSIDNSDWRFSTPQRDFESQIKYLKNNFNIVSLNEILKNKNLDKLQIAITFDDGYEDVYLNAFPIMKKYQIVASVFAIGDTKRKDSYVLQNDKKLLNKKQLAELVKNGWEIGYHTKSHTSLKGLNKKKLEYEIKSNFKYFAYPNGYYNDKIISTVIASNYEYAFSIDGGSLETKNRYLIPRIPLEGKMTVNQFASLLSPTGLIFSKIFMQILKFKENNIKPLFSHE